MERKTTNVYIDVDYLEEIIEKSGLTQREIAASIGRTKSFIWNAKSRGYMQRPAAELLCKLYDADINKLAPKPNDSIENWDETHVELPYDELSFGKVVDAIIDLTNKIDMLIRKVN